MFPKNAIVLNAFHSGCLRAGDGFIVRDAVLQPQIVDSQAGYVIDDRRDVL
jgi:hypothetical protein